MRSPDCVYTLLLYFIYLFIIQPTVIFTIIFLVYLWTKNTWKNECFSCAQTIWLCISVSLVYMGTDIYIYIYLNLSYKINRFANVNFNTLAFAGAIYLTFHKTLYLYRYSIPLNWNLNSVALLNILYLQRSQKKFV